MALHIIGYSVPPPVLPAASVSQLPPNVPDIEMECSVRDTIVQKEKPLPCHSSEGWDQEARQGERRGRTWRIQVTVALCLPVGFVDSCTALLVTLYCLHYISLHRKLHATEENLGAGEVVFPREEDMN